MLFEITPCPTLGDKWNTLTPRLKTWISPIHILSFLQPKSRGVLGSGSEPSAPVNVHRAGEQCGRGEALLFPKSESDLSSGWIGALPGQCPVFPMSSALTPILFERDMCTDSHICGRCHWSVFFAIRTPSFDRLDACLTELTKF